MFLFCSEWKALALFPSNHAAEEARYPQETRPAPSSAHAADIFHITSRRPPKPPRQHTNKQAHSHQGCGICALTGLPPVFCDAINTTDFFLGAWHVSHSLEKCHVGAGLASVLKREGGAPKCPGQPPSTMQAPPGHPEGPGGALCIFRKIASGCAAHFPKT